MQTKSRKLLSVLLTLLMMAGVIAVAPVMASAAPPVGPSGTATWDFTACDANGSGTGWSWVHATKTLTLNGVNHSTTAATALQLPGGATIVLNGTNTITSTYNRGIDGDYTCGIDSGAELTITGSGSLNVTGGVAGNRTYGVGILVDSLTISGRVAVTASAAAGPWPIGIYTATLTINGGTLTATGNLRAMFSSYTVPSGYQYTVSANADGSSPTTGTSDGSFVVGGTHKYAKIEAPPVCEIGVTQYYDLADALAWVEDGQTIKLLEDITYTSMITINGITVTFDLNGKTLNATAGLFVNNNSNLLLAKPINGQFNVTGHNSYLNGIDVGTGSKAEISNVTVGGLTGWCVVASGEIIVYGNVSNTYVNGAGVNVANGGKVTVEGTITVPAGRPYIQDNSTAKTPSDFTTPTTKPGYLTYTDGTSTVWVKGNAPAITTAALPGGTVGAAYSQTLAATGDTPVAWSVASGDLPGGLALNPATGVISGTPTAAGTFSFTVKAQNGCGEDTKALSIVIPSNAKDILTFSIPGQVSAATITGTNITVVMPYGTNVTSLVPTIGHNGASVSPASGTAQNFTNLVTYTVTAMDASTKAYTVTVTLAAAPAYTVTVSGGTGGGSYTAGQTVTVTANVPASGGFLTGQRFKEWTGAGVTFSNRNSASTTFTMPSQNVTVTAQYESVIRLWGRNTNYASSFLNWILCIVCFGWIWMAF